ncbi:hypothetical protein M3Y99_00369300 [Aphelenchoides fujianensis]|nr:hypothetical protein M3Y99_00369300 [Aphelenchoides fujianensis]
MSFVKVVKTEDARDLGLAQRPLPAVREEGQHGDRARPPPAAPLSKEEKAKLMDVQLEKSDYLERLPKLKPKRGAERESDQEPPYYGTFRKKSRVITGRRPFAISAEEVAYDVDSEAEWEEAQEQENGDECMSDNEEPIKDDEVLQDDFYVGHGYLSESEGSEDGRAGEDRSSKNRRSRKQLKVNIFGITWAAPDEKLAKKLHKRLKAAVTFDFSKLSV